MADTYTHQPLMVWLPFLEQYPLYIPPDHLKSLLLEEIDKIENAQGRDFLKYGRAVVDMDPDGNIFFKNFPDRRSPIYSLACKIGPLFGTGNKWLCYRDLVRTALGHAAQWNGNFVIDSRDNLAWGNNCEVLCPQTLLARLERVGQKKLFRSPDMMRELFRDLPVVMLTYGKWQENSMVLHWQQRLAAERKRLSNTDWEGEEMYDEKVCSLARDFTAWAIREGPEDGNEKRRPDAAATQVCSCFARRQGCTCFMWKE